jgi:hypothetical protein
MFAGKFLYVLWATGCQFSVFSDNTLLRNANAGDASSLFSYSSKTANTTLRSHIEIHHLELYLNLAEERGWEVKLPRRVTQAQLQEGEL